MTIDSGYISPQFINTLNRRDCVLHNVHIALCGSGIPTAQSIIPLLELVHRHNLSLLIVAHQIDRGALLSLLRNHLKLRLRICMVTVPPDSGELLQDIAIATGGIVLAELGKSVTIDQLGKAREISISRHRTLIIDGHGVVGEVMARIERLEGELEHGCHGVTELRRRIGGLADGVAVITVGGSSAVEVDERRNRYLDSLNATQAAIEEGIVAGGGLALLRCGTVLGDMCDGGDRGVGFAVVRDALAAPLVAIANNAGVNGNVVVHKLLQMQRDIGYDALRNEYVDMIDTGIIDPVKVLRAALTNAAGVASMLITTEVIVVDAIDDDIAGQQEM